jgi:outer membrane protein insertion porin family
MPSQFNLPGPVASFGLLLLLAGAGLVGCRGGGSCQPCQTYQPAAVYQPAGWAAPPPYTVPTGQYRYQSQDDAGDRGRLFDPVNQQFYVDAALEGELGKPQVIKDVVIEGNRRVPTAEFLRQLKSRPGRYFDPDLLQQDVQSIWRMSTVRRVQGPFINRAEDGITITFQVQEHPFISELKFVGNRVLSDSYLKKETGLEEGKPLNDFEVRMAREKIEELYRTRGHTYTSVEMLKTEDPTQVVFVIYEDQRRRIRSVSFEGNTIASTARLRVIVKSKAQTLGLFGGLLDREQVDRDVDLLNAYYMSLGYFSAKIGREIVADTDRAMVDIKFVINEGPRYRIRNVRLEGVSQYPVGELMDQLKLKPTEKDQPFFNGDAMSEDVMTLRDAYGSVGHIFADVQAQPHFLAEPGMIDIVYKIDEGKPYRVGRVNVQIDGDGITRRTVVLNRVTQKPGDLIDIRKIRQSERLLRASELFDDPQNPGNKPRIVVRPPEEVAGGLR